MLGGGIGREGEDRGTEPGGNGYSWGLQRIDTDRTAVVVHLELVQTCDPAKPVVGPPGYMLH